MQDGADTAIDGEARVKVEGGFASMPGLNRERVIPFADLAPGEARSLADLAHKADFFACAAPGPGHPGARDARTYTITLRIGAESREMRVTEPVQDPVLAELVSVIHRMGTARGSRQA